MTASTATPRRRPRRAGGEAAPQPATMNDRVLRLYMMKLAHDEAKRAYEAEKADVLKRMQDEGRNDFTLPGDGDRPSVIVAQATRVTTTVDPAKFKKKVSAAEFLSSVSVQVKEAKKHLGENDFEKVSTKTKSAVFLDVRTKGAS